MVATEVLLLAHVPPPASAKVVDEPLQIVVIPVILPGTGMTVTVLIVQQVVLPCAHVMIAVPPDIPVTIPEEDPTVAIEVLLLLHVPVPGPSVRLVVKPTQRTGAPVIADGNGLTVTVAYTGQSPLNE